MKRNNEKRSDLRQVNLRNTVEPPNSEKFGNQEFFRYCQGYCGVFHYFASSIVKNCQLMRVFPLVCSSLLRSSTLFGNNEHKSDLLSLIVKRKAIKIGENSQCARIRKKEGAK